MLLLLVKHEVKFMPAGGYSVSHYGYERRIEGMDIWL